jgi:hypothetical protein
VVNEGISAWRYLRKTNKKNRWMSGGKSKPERVNSLVQRPQDMSKTRYLEQFAKEGVTAMGSQGHQIPDYTGSFCWLQGLVYLLWEIIAGFSAENDRIWLKFNGIWLMRIDRKEQGQSKLYFLCWTSWNPMKLSCQILLWLFCS